jgi:hypothetical protein
MSMVILPKRPKIEVTEMRIIPVTSFAHRAFIGYAYSSVVSETCPCCHQLLKGFHTTKAQSTVNGVGLILEKFRNDNTG